MASFIQSYGLEALLTAADDPALWEAALRQHWPAVEEPNCRAEELRFEIGRRLGKNEEPQGDADHLHASTRGMLGIQEWCFERVSAQALRVKTCPTEVAPVSFFPGMGLSMLMNGSAAQTAPASVIKLTLSVSRPSLGEMEAVVYYGVSMPGVGQGNAHLWRRGPDGNWNPTDRRLAWWIT